MRKLYICATWKSNKTIDEAKKWFDDFALRMKTMTLSSNIEVVICVPFTVSAILQEEIKKSHLPIHLGAQTVSPFPSGPYTGEISAQILKGLAEYIIIGHSERRINFGETDDIVNKKIFCALENSMVPIVCVGETLDQREKGLTKQVVEDQLKGSLKGVTCDQLHQIFVCYEPIWAISKGDGRGKNATPEDAEEMHVFIRETLGNMYNTQKKETFTILYGGSVNKDNVRSLTEKQDIDGYLIGGASLDSEHFFTIVQIVSSMSQ